MTRRVKNGLEDLTQGLNNMSKTTKVTLSWFYHLGCIITIIMSWSVNHSVWWAILQCLYPFIYIPYWLIKYTVLSDYISKWMV